MPRKKAETNVVPATIVPADPFRRTIPKTDKVRGASRRVSRVPTMLYTFDWATGGGLPTYCPVVLYGSMGVGKTTAVMYLAGVFSNAFAGTDLRMADFEFTDPDTLYQYLSVSGYSGLLSLVPDRDEKDKPRSGESILNELSDGLLKPEIKSIILDSAAFVVPDAMLEGSLGEAHMGLSARLIRDFLMLTSARLRRTEPGLCLIVNHQRTAMGGGFGFRMPGGEAIKEIPQLITRVWREKELEHGDLVMCGKVEKNRYESRGGEFSMYIIGGWGVSRHMTAVWDAIQLGYATSDRVVTMDGKSYGKLADLSDKAVKGEVDVFAPFYTKLWGK